MLSGMGAKGHSTGFTLVEMGIVLAVIAALSTGVLLGIGYLRAAKQRAAVDLALSVRAAAGQYALRHFNGLSYGVADSNDVRNVSITRLQAEGFLTSQARTPWGSVNVTVTPFTDNGVCAGYTCIKLALEVPIEECTAGSELVVALKLKSINDIATCSNNLLEVVFR